MKAEKYINQIMEHTGLTRKEIQEMVNDKKKELIGLISEEGALFVIARELGADVKSKKSSNIPNRYGTLYNRISKDTGLTQTEIQRMIRVKRKELKGLISEKGALHLIAKALNVNLKPQNELENKTDKLKINSVESKLSLMVFMSYATKDSEFFKIPSIAETLTSFPEIKDVLYWQEDMKDNIYEYMSDNLGITDVMLLFCTPNSRKSKPVRKEWTAADSMDIPIIPIFIKKEDIPPLLRSRLGLEFDVTDVKNSIRDIYGLVLKKIEKNLA